MNDLEFVGDYRQPQLSARQRALGHDGSSAGKITFGDFLDVINPLQHIPVVSNIYRAITGDEISPHARILGDTLFGGPTGFLSSVANVLYEEIAGEDIGETAIALFTGDDKEDPTGQFAGDEGLGAPEAAPLETAAGAAVPAVGGESLPTGTSAELPEAAPGMLTGQDALDALFLDLRGPRRDAAAMPLAEPEAAGLPLPARAGEAAAAKSYPLPPRHVRVPATAAAATPPAPAVPDAVDAVHPLLFAQETAGGAIADRMMQALDQYQTMARQNAAARRDGSEPQQAAPQWQADPTSP